jgi:hypothetical protein
VFSTLGHSHPPVYVSDGYLYSCTPNIILTHYILSLPLSLFEKSANIFCAIQSQMEFELHANIGADPIAEL